MGLLSWFKKKKPDVDKSVEERWHPFAEDECGWFPIRPQKDCKCCDCVPEEEVKSLAFEDEVDDDVWPWPVPVPPDLPVIRKETVFSACSRTTSPGFPRIIVERGNEYPTYATDDGHNFPVIVPNVLRDRKLTREQIKEVFFFHQTHCIKKPPIGHPEIDNCPPHAILVERCENLFLGTDQKHFDHILLGLQKKFPKLTLEWKYGVLHVNGAKTRIKCKGIDAAYNTLRDLGNTDSVEEFVIELVGRQLHEIFAD